MKNLKKSVMSGLSFFVAIGAAFAFNVSGMLAETPIFREVPGSGGVMEDITTRCTLRITDALCSAATGANLPSEGGLYWSNAGQAGTPFQTQDVYQQVAP